MRIPDSLRRGLEIVFGIDLRTLALFRVLLGAVLFADLCLRLPDLGAFYTDAGVMPRNLLAAANGLWRISLHSTNGERWFVALLFLIEMIAALMILAGWRTRLATMLTFVLHASLLNRNPLIVIDGDVLIVCLLFWSLFLPLAARASVDAALARSVPVNNPHRSWASAGLLLQVLSVYFFAAVQTGNDWWPGGTVIDHAMRLDAYTTRIGQWLQGFPQLTQGLSYAFHFLGLLGPLLALSPLLNRPLRFIVMLLLMSMQLVFLLCFARGPEPFFYLVSLSLLAGGWLWDAAARAGERKAARRGALPLRIYIDRDCAACSRRALLLKNLLVLPRVEIAMAQDTPRVRALFEANRSWVVIDHDDHAYLKWPALTLLLRRSPVFAPLGWLLSGAWAVTFGDAFHDFLARRRAASRNLVSPPHERSFEVNAKVQGFAGVVLFLLLANNLASVVGAPNWIDTALAPPLRILRLDQNWKMSAPFASTERGWFVIPGQLPDGGELDLMHPGRRAVSYEKPQSIASEWPNVRWHEYMDRLRLPEVTQNRPQFGSYLCRTWNDEHDSGRQLKGLKIIYMLALPISPGQLAKFEQSVLARQECPGSTAADTR